MKILHLTKKYPEALGGDAITTFNLEKEQKLKNNKLFILTTNCDDIINKNNVIKFGLKDNSQNLDTITIKRLISLGFLFIYSFFLIKKIKPSVIHSHSADMGLVFVPACKIYKVPIINTCEGVNFPYKDVNIFKRFLEKNILKYGGFNKITTVDEKSISDFHQARIMNVSYVPNAVDISKFKQTKKNNEKLKKMHFIFVGRIDRMKGLIYLIDAVDIMKKENRNFVVDIVGDGPMMQDIQEKVKYKKMSEYIIFHGKKTANELPALYSQANIFVLPSLKEGFPTTLLEAWASGLPVIVTNVGGISSICTNNHDSIIIPPKSSRMLATAMINMMKDSNLRKKISFNGNINVRKNYSWSKISDKYLKIYGDLIEHN